MLTRREVLLQLKRVGVTEVSQLKIYLRDFEKYMAENHGVLINRIRTSLVEERGGASSFLYSGEKSIYFRKIDSSNSDPRKTAVRMNTESKKGTDTTRKPRIMGREKKKSQ
ncbi:MAG: hypothetical protein H6Q42_665 [Deltaproteobacteria bacterium]|nr:hypothetical protein [Deltaproteobacteria bacterium]